MDQRIASGGFGALNVDFQRLQGSTAAYTGGGGGFIASDVRIGVFFSGLTNNYSKQDTSNISYKLGSSYGGLWVAYPIYLNNRNYHPIFDIKIGYGGMRLINTNWQIWDASQFIGVSGSVGLEYKLTEILFVAGGFKYNYNYLFDDLIGFKENDFNSFGLFLSIRLGLFQGEIL